MPLGRGFSVLWSANALSNLADGIAFVSMPLLAAMMTDDPRLVARLATMYALIRLLVALPIGVWVDRFDRRTLLVTCLLSLRQRIVPDGLLGRVGAAARVLGLLGLALGSALGGILGTADLAIPVAVGGVVFVICCVVAMVTLRGDLEGTQAA